MKIGIRAKPSFKDYMKDNDLTNIDIADMTGLSDRTVSNFKRGKSCSMGVAILIARELELSLYDIIER